MSRYISSERLFTLCAGIMGLLLLVTNSRAYSKNDQNQHYSLTLQQALKSTLAQNPNLDIFQFRQQILQGDEATAALAPSYQLGVEVENVAGSGEFRGIDNAELTVSLSSAIELGGKIDARLGVVKSKRSYLEVQQELQALELLAETTRRFIQLLSAQERVKLAQESLQLSQETLEAVKRRVSLGATMKAEIKRAEASLAQAQLTLQKEQTQQTINAANLAAMWSELQDKTYTASGNLFQFEQVLSFEQLYGRVQQNPSIKQFATLQRLRQSELDLVEANSQSNLNWSVGVTRSQLTGDIGVTAGFSMDLLTESRSQGAFQSARAAKEEVFVSKRAALLRMHNQLFKAYQQRQQAIRSVQQLSDHIIPSLEQALDDTGQAYQRGRYSYLEYVSARQELIAAKRKLIDAAAAALMFGVTIEQLTAEPLSLAQKNL